MNAPNVLSFSTKSSKSEGNFFLWSLLDINFDTQLDHEAVHKYYGNFEEEEN